nr:MAG TPA: hypothetical protein [Caudoviricetes sp.]
MLQKFKFIQNDSLDLTPNYKVDLGVRLGVRF